MNRIDTQFILTTTLPQTDHNSLIPHVLDDSGLKF